MTCLPVEVRVEERIDRVLTQYRESPKLLFLLRAYLSKVAEMSAAVCDMPEKFDLDTATGDQLTIVGKRLGFPRCHCICDVQPVFGFDCVTSGPTVLIADFCDGNATWQDCGEAGIGFICINDDDLYRKFLRSRVLQYLARFDITSLELAVVDLWGPTARVLDAGHGRVVLAPGRDLSNTEIALLQVYPRVLPVALGIEVRLHFGPIEVFGFGDGWGGFCEEWQPDGLPLMTEDGDLMVTEDGDPILTGPLTQDAEWMCEIDPLPYSCVA